jgi:flagellar hook-basal body complex protein FliE
MIDPMSAAKAYAAVQSAGGPPSTGAVGDLDGAMGGGGSFSSILQNAIHDAVQSSKTAETQMSAQVQGKAQMIDVATAISSAETNLQTVIAVRDQVISAYQEIMRMTI